MSITGLATQVGSWKIK